MEDLDSLRKRLISEIAAAPDAGLGRYSDWQPREKRPSH